MTTQRFGIGRRDLMRNAAIAAGGSLLASVGISESASAAESQPSALPASLVTGTVGFTHRDLEPRTSSLSSFGVTSAFTFDWGYRSVGIDLGGPTTVNSVAVATDSPAHRCTYRDFSVYSSTDNLTWVKNNTVKFTDLGTEVWFYGFSITARYLKVHCHQQDGNDATATFRKTNLQHSIRAYNLGNSQFIAGDGQWLYRTQITVQNSTATVMKDRAVYISFTALDVTNLVATGRLNADLSDLRFADDSGIGLQSYADHDGVYVRIPVLAASTYATIYAYSGNATARSVVRDAGALQVEYGHHTYQVHTEKSAGGLTLAQQVHPVSLPDGTLMLAAATTPTGGLHAKFSTNQGRTWAIPEQIAPPCQSTGFHLDGAGGFLVDPTNGVLTAAFYSLNRNLPGYTGDWRDPAQHDCSVWIRQASTYTATGRPNFGPAVRLNIINPHTGNQAAYSITYTNPIRTSSGAYLVFLSYVYSYDPNFESTVFRSTDGGAMWTQSSTPLAIPGSGGESGVSESSMIQLANGNILVYSRQQDRDRFYLAKSISTDDGQTFSALVDSDILASNTVSNLQRRPDNSIMLTWAGHNAKSQGSYYRNNLTAAWSDNEAGSWRGYHDLTSSMSISTPGWKNDETRMVESFPTPAGDNDLLIGWPQSVPSTLLIEEIDSYLKHSHGASDVLGYFNAAGATNGTELSQSKWWRSTPDGLLSLVAGPRTSSKAIRLVTTTSTSKSGTSRLFPGVRSARISFWIRHNGLSSGLHLCLQEGFSTDHNARGTVASLKLSPSGEVLYTSDDLFNTVPQVGYIAGDPTPATGNLDFIGRSGALAFDYARRSIGLDLGIARDINSLKLIGSTTFGATTRLLGPELTVWTSPTNGGNWTQATGWTATKSGLIFTFSGPTINARYVKIVQPYADTAFTFANYQNQMLAMGPARPDLEERQSFNPLPTPTTLTAGNWHRIDLHLDMDNGVTGIAIDGTTKGSLGQVHDAMLVTHLMLLTDSGGTTDVAISELQVQDLSEGTPDVFRVGASLPTQTERRRGRG